MELIKELRTTLRHLRRLSTLARERKLDDMSIEDLATAYSALHRVLFRMEAKGLIDPSEVEEIEREEEDFFRRLLETHKKSKD